ncbi:site-specific integrase [Halarchaeum sp. CBA1220]|uniref:tyrosine-type recombinase/integrase n=1 Tax=Halarchaeum sp. CBA1220 TaxID=1853682 RepID=UPI0011CD5280|nr:site-specific integrase [Halarchaeum sp. CBA1220]QLC34337.1 site-specific integrase [Halarchaeum sp. CBA1220]
MASKEENSNTTREISTEQRMYHETDDGEKIRLMTETAKRQFDEPVIVGLYRGQYAEWLLEEGIEEDDGSRVGHSVSGATNLLYRLDQIQRYCHDQFGHNPTAIGPRDAEQFSDALLDDEWLTQTGKERSDDDKRKLLDALEKYFEFLAETEDRETWKARYKPQQTSYESYDDFKLAERFRLREAALEYGSLPAYSKVSAEQRTRIKRYLSQKLGKPMSDITPDDWERNSSGLCEASLIWTALDLGLTPKEVGAATFEWINLSAGTVNIPSDEESKDREDEDLALLPDTVQLLREWRAEREHLDKYDDSNRVWLNRVGNPYSSGPLNRLIRQLCDEAGIETEHRKIAWYSIRHSLGQYLRSVGDLYEANDQLRHGSLETTKVYSDTVVEDRRESLQAIYERAEKEAEREDQLGDRLSLLSD